MLNNALVALVVEVSFVVGFHLWLRPHALVLQHLR